MLRKLLVSILLFYSFAAAQELQSEYFVEGDTITLKTIIPSTKEETTLYNFANSKNIKRVKSSLLIKKLKKLGYRDFEAKHAYVQFSKKSPVDTSFIKNALRNYYKKNYSSITIDSIEVNPRTYMEQLPKEYSFGIQKDSFLQNSGYCYIVTPEKKKIFFRYLVSAHILAYHARQTLIRGEALGKINLVKKSIMLSKFRAKPLEELPKDGLEAKHRVKKGTLITLRDTATLVLVKRGERVHVTLRNSGIAISFEAEAITDGRLGESVTIQKSDNKRLIGRVVGKNQVEI